MLRVQSWGWGVRLYFLMLSKGSPPQGEGSADGLQGCIASNYKQQFWLIGHGKQKYNQIL